MYSKWAALTIAGLKWPSSWLQMSQPTTTWVPLYRYMRAASWCRLPEMTTRGRTQVQYSIVYLSSPLSPAYFFSLPPSPLHLSPYPYPSLRCCIPVLPVPLLSLLLYIRMVAEGENFPTRWLSGGFIWHLPLIARRSRHPGFTTSNSGRTGGCW
jgi:hypothetical protein